MGKNNTLTYDLNIFWEEFYSDYAGQWFDDRLTIDVYIYEQGDGILDRREAGLKFKVSREESLIIAEHFPEKEYGYDWFVFMDSCIDVMPEGVKEMLSKLPALENKGETKMVDVVEKKVEVVSMTSVNAYSVEGASYVPDGVTVQLNFSTHARPGGGIVATSSVALTTEEAVELMDRIENALAENKRAENERNVDRDFYLSQED